MPPWYLKYAIKDGRSRDRSPYPHDCAQSMGVFDVVAPSASIRSGCHVSRLQHKRSGPSRAVRAIELLGEVGYQGVALTIDHGLLNPYNANWQVQAASLRRKCSSTACTR